MILNTQEKVTRLYSLNMKHQHLTLLTRMALLSAIGVHFLIWHGACWLKIVCQNNCGLMQSRLPLWWGTGVLINAQSGHQPRHWQAEGLNCLECRGLGQSFVHKQDKRKLDPRWEKYVFIGYDKNSPEYTVYFPDTKKVQKHRLVKFVAKTGIGQQNRLT